MIDDSPIIIRSKEMSSKERLSISVEILAGRNFFYCFTTSNSTELTPSQDHQIIQEIFQFRVT